ncbi:MAG: DNA recombination protein RmuC [Candidatus Omnitrophica bacterium]|nr:DNA recombination protein RmuC [Candidatus Omnitrophota bacterium]
MNIVIIVGIVLGLAFIVGLFFVMSRILKQQAEAQANILKDRVREEIKLSQDQFLQLAKQQFETEQKQAAGELETRKQAVDNTVKSLSEQLDKYQKIMREFEQDRTQKYGNLENELKNASQATAKLQETTSYLNNVLGNVKLRGQWGERMAEDIIQYAGLLEGVNYKKQKKLDKATTKPDFTFLLPDEHKINMDVKFPLDNYTKMVNAEVESEKESYQDEFLKNVKERIKEIQNRDYINPAENTLDFVLLFIPNEQVFGFIQETMPDLFDVALKQKVVLCSPFTLYAMLSVVRQSYENFLYEKNIKKIILLVDGFKKIYDRFKSRFEDLGTTIGKVEKQYSDLSEKSFKKLDAKIRHIDSYKKGSALLEEQEEVVEIDAPAMEEPDEQATV